MSNNIDLAQPLANDSKGRNRQIDVMLAIGIISVVFGHINSSAPLFHYLFFPPYAYHIPLFFFISGYLFKPQSKMPDKGKSILKKIRTQLIPYHALAIIFAVLTVLLKKISINLGTGFSWQTILFDGFLNNNTYKLFGACWFLFTLFFINVLAIMLYQKKKWIDVTIAILTLPLMVYMIKYFSLPESMVLAKYIPFIGKMSIGFLFFSGGYVFKIFENKIKKYLLRPITVVIIFFAVLLIFQITGNKIYDIAALNFGQEENRELLNILTTFGIIFILYIIGYHVANIVNGNSVFWIISENTFSIMAWHFTFFLLTNFILFQLGIVEYDNLSNVRYINSPEKFMLLYQTVGIFGSVLLSVGYKKMRRWIWNNIFKLI